MLFALLLGSAIGTGIGWSALGTLGVGALLVFAIVSLAGWFSGVRLLFAPLLCLDSRPSTRNQGQPHRRDFLTIAVAACGGRAD